MKLLHLAVGIGDGRDAQFQVAIVAAAQTGRDGFADQGGMEGAEIWAEYFGIAESFVESSALDGTVTPVFEGGIGPDDVQIGLHHGHAFAQHFENEVGLQQRADPLPGLGLVGGSEDAVEALGLQQGQPFGDAAGPHHLPAGTIDACLSGVALKYQHSRPVRQG